MTKLLLRNLRQPALRLVALPFALLPFAARAQSPEVRQTADSVYIDLDSLQKHAEQSHPLPAWISSLESGTNIVPSVASLHMGAPIPRLTAGGPRLRPLVSATAQQASGTSGQIAPMDVAPPAAAEQGTELNVQIADETVAAPSNTTRLRLRRASGLAGSLLVRLYFDDETGRAPVVTAWNEIGDCLFQSRQLGGGIEMTTTEDAVVPVTGVSYLEISMPGDGSNLHGLLLAELKDTVVRTGVPFDGNLPPNATDDPAQGGGGDAGDSFLYDRVRAVIDNGMAKLPPGGGAAYDFSLEEAPEVAVVTFEVLNGDVAVTPDISVNGSEAAPVTALLPDLADPAYQETVVAGQAAPLYRYKGWLRCQRIVSGTTLRAGDNHLEITSRERGAEIAVRAVRIELKYHHTNP